MVLGESGVRSQASLGLDFFLATAYMSQKTHLTSVNLGVFFKIIGLLFIVALQLNKLLVSCGWLNNDPPAPTQAFLISSLVNKL